MMDEFGSIRGRIFCVCFGISLVGGFKHFFFSILYGIILPIDFHIYQDVFSPPTRSYPSNEILPWYLVSGDPFIDSVALVVKTC